MNTSFDQKGRARALTGTLTVALFVGALGLTGCYQPPPVYYVKGPPKAVRLPTAPPAPRVELPPPAPDQSYLWLDGYWHWDGVEYYWVEGRWTPPEPTYEYVAASYFFSAGWWYYRPRFWRHRRRHHRRHHRRRHRRGEAVAAARRRPAVAVDRPAPGPGGKTRRPAPEVAGQSTRSRRRAPPAPSIYSARKDRFTGRRAPSSPDRIAGIDRPRQRHRPTVVLGSHGAVLRKNKGANQARLQRSYYRRDRTGAIVLRSDRPRAWRRPRGSLTVITPHRAPPITPAANVRRRRVLLSNPGWSPRRSSTPPRQIPPPRASTPSHRQTRGYQGARTYRPTRSVRTYRPTRSVRTYRPTRQSTMRHSAPTRSYHRRSSSSGSSRRAPSSGSSSRRATSSGTVHASSGFRRR